MVNGFERPEWMDHIQAVLFDMDGTLIDSEHLTARAIQMLLDHIGSDLVIDGTWFHGLTWRSIATTLRTRTTGLAEVEIEKALQSNFHAALVHTRPPAIPGAREAVRSAARNARAAVVSSSDRVSVLHVVDRLEIQSDIDEVVAAEDCDRSKPDPQCFQIAADRLGVHCQHCLVFEDSVAGLTAGRAAGMRTIAIGEHHADSGLADLVIENFHALPPDFFDLRDLK